MRLLRFGNGTGAYVFPKQHRYEDNFLTLLQRTQRLPGVSGGYRIDGFNASAKEIGAVMCTVWLLADTPAAMQAKIDALAKLQSVGVQQLYMRAFGDPNDTGVRWVYAEVKSVELPMSVETTPARVLEATIRFECADPYWHQLGAEAWKWGDGTLWGGGALWGGGGTTYPLPLTQNDIVETVAGNAATYPRIVLSLPAGASAAGFTLQRRNDSGGVLDEISFSDALTAGDVLIVNARDMSVKLNGVNAFSNAFDFARANFFRLEPGANRLRITFDSVTGAPKLRLRYYTRW